MDALPRPLEHPVLRSYLNEVIAWHGYIRFLGLPTLGENPDVQIDLLYIAPALATAAISPESDPAGWPPTLALLDTLRDKRRLVVLGDPGSGKSTLVNWLAWRLSAGLTSGLPEWCADLLPIPLVLRELDLSAITDFDSLLAAFLKQPVAQALGGEPQVLIDYLAAGRALLLLDGLDEVPTTLRTHVRDAVWQAWRRFPQSYTLATSRIVGYEECPLDTLRSAETRLRTDAGTSPLVTLRMTDLLDPAVIEGRLATLAYVAPFDDARIEAFAQNWYRLRSAAAREASDQAVRFLGALRREASTWRLARTPNLLTIMALVFRVRLELPEGRGLLYEDIAQAYLESIDKFRGLGREVYPWREKKRWLARIGFEMQLRREKSATREEAKAAGAEADALLAEESLVLQWIAAAMQNSGYPPDQEFAREYLTWIARRSGLLLPRGEGRYAFLHLSFQEYFAAVYLVEQIKDPEWLSLPENGATDTPAGLDARVTRARLKASADSSLWRETLVFAFELLGQEPRWAAKLAEWVFGANFGQVRFGGGVDAYAKSVYQDPAAGQAVLLARLVIDPHAGLAPTLRQAAWERCWEYCIDEGRIGRDKGSVLVPLRSDVMPVLVSSEAGSDEVLRRLRASPPAGLALQDCRITDLAPWAAACAGLRWLNLIGCPIANLQALSSLVSLEVFAASMGLVDDPSPLGQLRRLRFLALTSLEHSEGLDFLEALQSLEEVVLAGGQVRDLAALARLPLLHSLLLISLPVSDLSPLAALRHLERLTLIGIAATDLSPLSGLTALRELQITVNENTDLSPVEKLPNLTIHRIEAPQRRES